MSLCPWCKAVVPGTGSSCPACGKHPDDHPSLQGGGPSSPPGFDDDEVGSAGDVVLDPAAPAQPDSQYGYDDRFDDDMDEAGGSLELQVEAAAPAMPQPPAVPPAPRPQPSRPDVPHTLALDPVEIAVLADFGPVPKAVWACPLYALRVFQRSAELRRLLRVAQKNAEEVELVRDDQLAAIAERLRPALAEDRELAGFLAPLSKADQLTREREQALGQRSAEYASIVGAIDGKLASEEQAAAGFKVHVEEARDEHTRRSQLLSRAQAALKRAEIELRNAQDLARAAAGPEARTAPPEHAQAIVAAQSGAEQRRQELAGPRAEAEVSARTLRDAEAQLEQVEQRIAALRSERRKAESTFSREMGLRSEGLDQARAERRNALIALGARLFELNSELVPAADQEAFHRIRADVSARHIETERTMRAIASADASAVKKGWIVLGAAAALVIALIALALSRR